MLGITDPARPELSDVTQKYRRGLVLSSSGALAVAGLGLVPTKVSALGIELDASDRIVIALALALIVVYFAIGFLLHGLADAAEWIVRSRERHRADLKAEIKLGRVSEDELTPAFRRWEALAEGDPDKAQAYTDLRAAEAKAAQMILDRRSDALLARGNLTRAIFEFGVPIVMALAAFAAAAGRASVWLFS